ncbi:uncharacterized protein MONOS_11465 [Monocercomonoides exilis]|uniref:uncharacterized protein n=1 Tax=Monocercomonoides exilis TaxID=2049356 RepID=UPI00355A09AC|nr:hypothetical protein MONOS_11465 [Monocercomonoides exilis]|eukprot:MONOS_11465.1-p1 / transcript=MONOS_11465.1 / gene=MONOS_11465 / organism=Monocercomonoides_exilis_PA203 / gene_product=unspecified product / transcript_product=unspecified product / location=Mono_scaffold00577:37560-37913(-) / protein_length=118 / sequence_SO=supercontig / SO=protein_coding / is_pseudo=false
MNNTVVEMKSQGASRELTWRAEEPVSWSMNIWWGRWKVMKGRSSTSRSGSVGGVRGEAEVENERGRWRPAVGSTNPLSSSSELMSALGMFQLKWAASATAYSMVDNTNTILSFFYRN